MAIRNWGIVTLATAGLMMGCGGDDGPSYGSVVSSIESPTGTVDASTTPDVIAEFEAAQSAGAGAGASPFGSFASASASEAVQKQDIGFDYGATLCTGGGDASFDGGESGGTIRYMDCCFGADFGADTSCCLSGKQDVFVGEGMYATCMSYSITATCGGSETVNTTFDGCFGPSGEMIYSVEVEGESFAVSVESTYYEGTGTLSITGQNGSFTCTLTDYSGTCTSDSGTSFEV